ncbi:hypothetical protein L226DRAFT_554852 [Lentinus tigrinus ALCF2SS1-7]|uniref:Uncharacterized protein n=1 Tax=Lentinus tigrinus ALCF2SS1-6 TaxID=1328759 RepID=A0A5C2RWR8_9APHY|nr:hypothetical protein L227DRAFT_555342 [Lentinus tigrinus ALCF2SS1-6]RPD70331.1 hypothetical protein L226DRAFT_554852 [Lentinus tigrinus ALCF2SS1-7]
MSTSSARFASIYDSLPPDVQRTIVEKQLIPLLDQVNKGKCKKVLASASKMQRRHAGIPVLDIKAKKREVNTLLDELHRDAKRSFVKERSHRSELLEQTVESVTSWLNDIWRVVYEHNVDFALAHECLLFTMNTLDQIGHGRASCRCAFTSMYVPIILKRRSGKVVKSWHVNGAHNIEEVLQFIWRDLFLSMLATGSQRQIKRIPEMLDDIEDLLGWSALEKLLYGGRKCPHDIDDIDDEISVLSDVDEDEDAYTDEDSDLDAPIDNHDWLPKVPETPSPSHAKHWSSRISNQMWSFRKHVHAAMMSVFKINPSLRLYSAILANSTDPETTAAELMTFLNEMAPSCPEVFAAALDIHSLERNTITLASLLTSYSHLIRPRDAVIYQSAVTTLGGDPFQQQRALEIIEKELLDTTNAVRAALLNSFSLLNTSENKTEIEQILKLRPSAAGRQDRIERWVDAVVTPGTNTPNPMAFAAMVMGLPIVPALDGSEDADPLGYLDLDPTDPDMEDLRDEFRPRLKQRFEGWADAGIAVKGGPAVLVKVYRELTKSMPWLRASDVVEEMLSRLAEKPSKQYLIDAVDALSAFVKVQRRKLSAAKSEQKRRAAAATQTSTPSPAAAPSVPAFTFTVPPAPEAAEAEAGDERPETPPPPLEPVTPAPAPLFTFYTGAVPGPGDAGAGTMYGGGIEDVD